MTDRPTDPAGSLQRLASAARLFFRHLCVGNTQLARDVARLHEDRGIVERRNGNSKNSEVERFLCRSFHRLGFDFFILRRPDGCSKLFFLSSFSYYFYNNSKNYFSSRNRILRGDSSLEQEDG